MALIKTTDRCYLLCLNNNSSYFSYRTAQIENRPFQEITVCKNYHYSNNKDKQCFQVKLNRITLDIY